MVNPIDKAPIENENLVNQDSISENGEKEQIIEETKTGLDSVKTAAQVCNESKDVQQSIQSEVLSQQKMKKVVAVLLEKYKNLRKWIHGTEWNTATKRELKHWLDQNIKTLNDINRELDRYNYSDLSQFEARLWQLQYNLDHYEQNRQIVSMWWSTNDIPASVDSVWDAKYLNKSKKRQNKQQLKMNESLRNATITSLRNDDMENYEEYLEAVVNGQVDANTHPFYKRHEVAFNRIRREWPSLYAMLVPSSAGRISYLTYCEHTWKPILVYNGAVSGDKKNESFVDVVWDQFSEVVAHFVPSIESNPRQKEARSRAWSLLALWWSIIMWVKLIKNLFSKKSNNPDKWKNVAWLWVGLLALTHTDDIYQWVQDAFNWHPAEKTKLLAERFQNYWFNNDVEAYKMAENYVWAPIAAVAALHFIPVYELTAKEIIKNGHNGLSFNYDNYKNYIEKNYSWWDSKQKEIVLEAGEKLKDDKLLNDWLRVFGVTSETDLQNMSNGDINKEFGKCEAVEKWWQNCYELFENWPHAELFSEWLKVKNAEDLTEITREYKENKDKVDELILKWMKEWKLEVTWNESFQLANMLNDENINIEQKTIKWLVDSQWKEIKFKSYWEMFRVAHLTEWIKNNFNWQSALTPAPFHIDNVFWNMEFDNTEWYEIWKNETSVLRASTFNNDFPTLNENKQVYVNYLNSWWMEKSWIDLSSYSMLKGLWLVISSPDEAQKLNERLEKIKSESNILITKLENGEYIKDPYRIDGKNLVFVWPSGENIVKIENLDELTYTRLQKDKLLNYLNNKDNGMYAYRVDS